MGDWLRRLAGAAARLRQRAVPSALATAQLGRRGEDHAARHLRRAGYRILERNYRTRRGEVDLVVFREGVVAFVEVRSQTEPTALDPALTVTRRKQARVIRAAQAYVTQHGLSAAAVALRFDVVTVLFDRARNVARVRHIENAFAETPGAFA